MAGEVYSAMAVRFQLGFSGSFSALQAGMRLEGALACGTGSCQINASIE